ncbi:MAG: hypothetical protein DRO67_06575 [Candidatus Asgardarchaeum californiense]|nr:MAG: hypothetical protein DRO67_06575 [Candidatus Asgardarchaeum californiense]
MSNLVGKKFGRLIVVELENEFNKTGRQLWKCICDCGKNVKVTTNHLTKGDTVSCGCFQKEKASVMAAQRIGLKNHNWKGGISCEP